MMCNSCGRRFRAPEGEEGEHDCPNPFCSDSEDEEVKPVRMSHMEWQSKLNGVSNKDFL